MKLLPEHCSVARGMLKITQAELAKAAGVSATTVHSFENRETSPSEDTLYRIQKALEDRGIAFINGGNPGVRLMKNPG